MGLAIVDEARLSKPHARPYPDQVSLTKGMTGPYTRQRSEIGHSHLIGANDKSMIFTSGREGRSYYLARIVNVRSTAAAISTAQGAKADAYHAIGAGPKCLRGTVELNGLRWRRSRHLTGIIDTG